jgi:catechol 2,3-dioxygenase-like lactoylglutathione lyase family enzyme
MQLTLPDYVILIVDDLDRALRFYIDVLGLRLGHRSGDYAQLDTGATRLAFYTRGAMARTLGFSLQPPAQDAPGFEIGFKVADVDAAFAELVAHGATAVTAPTTRPWGQRTAYVRDPDGHLIELAQDLGRS